MDRKAFTAPGTATAGPYSHAVEAHGNLVFLSHQTPVAVTGGLVEGGVGDQVRQCFRNLDAVLSAAGLGLDDVVKCNVFLVDMADFGAMNDVYAEHFRAPLPIGIQVIGARGDDAGVLSFAKALEGMLVQEGAC